MRERSGGGRSVVKLQGMSDDYVKLAKKHEMKILKFKWASSIFIKVFQVLIEILDPTSNVMMFGDKLNLRSKYRSEKERISYVAAKYQARPISQASDDGSRAPIELTLESIRERAREFDAQRYLNIMVDASRSIDQFFQWLNLIDHFCAALDEGDFCNATYQVVS